MPLDTRKLSDEITTQVILGLHYLQNYDNVSLQNDVSGLTFLHDGGQHRYMHDAKFHAQVSMLANRIIKVVIDEVENATR